MTDTASLQTIVEAAWEARDDISSATTGEVRDAVDTALDLMDKGAARVAEKIDGDWHINQWLKMAVLLSFRLNDSFGNLGPDIFRVSIQHRTE